MADPRRIAGRWVQARLRPPPKMTREVQDWAESAFLDWLRVRSVMPGGSRERLSRFYIQPAAEKFFNTPPVPEVEDLRIDLTGWKYKPSKEIFDQIGSTHIWCQLEDEGPEKTTLANWRVHPRGRYGFGTISIFAEAILREHDLLPGGADLSKRGPSKDLTSEVEATLKRLQGHEVEPEFGRDKQWTIRFLQSLLKQMRQGRPLSKKQRALLDEKIKRYGQWGRSWTVRPKYGRRRQKLLPNIDAKTLKALIREVRQSAFHEMVHFSQYYLSAIKRAEGAIGPQITRALGFPSRGISQGYWDPEEDHAVREIEFYPRLQDEIAGFLAANPGSWADRDSLRQPMRNWVKRRQFFLALESQKPRLHRKALSEFYKGVHRRAEEERDKQLDKWESHIQDILRRRR